MTNQRCQRHTHSAANNDNRTQKSTPFYSKSTQKKPLSKNEPIQATQKHLHLSMPKSHAQHRLQTNATQTTTNRTKIANSQFSQYPHTKTFFKKCPKKTCLTSTLFDHVALIYFRRPKCICNYQSQIRERQWVHCCCDYAISNQSFIISNAYMHKPSLFF